MAGRNTSDWLPRVLIESALIVMSILVALGLDEWRENREDAETVQQALANFHREIQQNRSRLEYAKPVNEGLLNVLKGRYDDTELLSVDEFVDMMEIYETVNLQSTAWETALATGSLAKMDYNIVSALSLTYSLQNRYQLATRSGMAELTSPQNLSSEILSLAIYNTVRYLDDITTLETDLDLTYGEAADVIFSVLTDDDKSRSLQLQADAGN